MREQGGGRLTSELADKAFSRSKTRDDTARRHALHDVLAVPGNEMSVIDDVLLTILELLNLSATSKSPC